MADSCKAVLGDKSTYLGCKVALDLVVVKFLEVYHLDEVRVGVSIFSTGFYLGLKSKFLLVIYRGGGDIQRLLIICNKSGETVSLIF